MQDNLARAVLKGDFLLKFTYPTTYKTIVSWVRIPLPPSTLTASLLKKKASVYKKRFVVSFSSVVKNTFVLSKTLNFLVFLLFLETMPLN